MVTPDADGQPLGGNEVIVASDTVREYDFDAFADGATIYWRPEVESYARGSAGLRDDFAPVDQLISPRTRD